MRRLFLLTLLFGIGDIYKAHAFTEMVTSNEFGPTYIDTIGLRASIKFKTNFQYDQPKITYAHCPRNKKGDVLKNYFVYKKMDQSGVLRDESKFQTGLTCDQLVNQNSSIDRGSCHEYTALELFIDDPEECKKGHCQQLAQPRMAETPPIKLDGEKVQKELQTCSAGQDRQFVVAKAKDNSLKLIANLKDKYHCRLDNKRILTPGTPWDDETSDLTKIFTSSTADDFYVGDPTKFRYDSTLKRNIHVGNYKRYYFDYKQKTWCQHMDPHLAVKLPTCQLTETTLPINFRELNNTALKGVIKFSLDQDGNPLAYVGHSKSSTNTPPYELDESKPLIKISLQNDPVKGRRAIFQVKNALNGNTLRKITVAPTYTMGTDLGQPGTCDGTACLSAVKEVMPVNFMSEAQCKNSSAPFMVPGNGRDICYSCSGISSGNCGTDPTVLTKSNINQYLSQLKACQMSPPHPQNTLSPAVTK
ncbi:MAG: hypothetical protein H6623_07660 [Bdellovibrionaceae bacterium]|nr:hypothetical protein [Pseudobdellovibrionaceae bacterium]